MDETDIGADLEKILVSEQEIQTKIVQLADEIDRDYDGRDLLLVGVLKGALMVMADLSRALRSPVTMDWMAVSSYGSGTKSSGVVRILKDLDGDISGRHVLVVEDIIDSGLTLSWLLLNLRSRGPASVDVFALLRKPEAARCQLTCGMSASTFRASSSWATDWTTRSATATCLSWAPWPLTCTGRDRAPATASAAPTCASGYGGSPGGVLRGQVVADG